MTRKPFLDYFSGALARPNLVKKTYISCLNIKGHWDQELHVAIADREVWRSFDRGVSAEAEG